jgi:D-sedoheptulose 7-phosphate isomerase
MNPEFCLNELIERYPMLDGIRQDIWEAYLLLEKSFANGGKLYVCGNGGSAADALHIVGELMKAFVLNRPVDDAFAKRAFQLFPDCASHMIDGLQGALPAYALVENSALSLAYANDVRADMIFAQQVYGYARPGDVLLGISTSGNAKNVVNAVKVAQVIGVKTIVLTGGTGGTLKPLCDIPLVMPASKTYIIQEYHLPVYHALCLMLEQRFFGDRKGELS